MINQPTHIAIIMDGNGRWAKTKGMNRTAGHEKGSEVVRNITTFCANHKKIELLTLYAFSTENWKRPKFEIEFLMKLLERHLKNELPTYLERNIRFNPIGDLEIFSSSLRKTIDHVQKQTSECTGLTQNLALNYGGQDEIIRAANQLIKRNISITIDTLSQALDAKENVDLLIRTGGDHRISNFLLWQSAYAELFFTDTLWPDFTSEEMEKIITKFQTIERRFGGII